jgi:hypothetical protein
LSTEEGPAKEGRLLLVMHWAVRRKTEEEGQLRRVEGESERRRQEKGDAHSLDHTDGRLGVLGRVVVDLEPRHLVRRSTVE